jgi:hypothetical protein
VTGGGGGIGVELAARSKIFFHSVRTDSATFPTFFPKDEDSPMVKWPRPDAGRAFPSSTEVKNAWGSVSAARCIFVV